MDLTYIASSLLGACIGLICAAIFATILRRIEEKNPNDAINKLIILIGYILGGGTTDYIIFDSILKMHGALVYYIIGLSAIFLIFGLIIFISRLLRS